MHWVICFSSVPTEQSIRRYGVRFKGIVKMAHSVLPKYEIEGMMNPFLVIICITFDEYPCNI